VDCIIDAVLDGYATVITNISLAEAAGAHTIVVLQLPPRHAMRGVVVDADSKAPVPFAHVAAGADRSVVTCDAQGCFALGDIAQRAVDVRVWHEQYPTQSFRLFIPGDHLPFATINVQRGARVFGRVLDQKRLPVPACHVTYRARRDTPDEFEMTTSITATDGNGCFDFPLVMPAMDAHVAARTSNAAAGVSLTVAPGEIHDVALVLTAHEPPRAPAQSNGWLHVTARRPDGTIADRFRFMPMYASRGALGVGQSARGGSSMSVQSVGTLSICVFEGPQPVLVSNIIIRYQQTTSVHVVVGAIQAMVVGAATRANGTPAAGLKLSAQARDAETDWLCFACLTDSRGEFALSVLRPDGRYQIVVENGNIPADQPREPVSPGDFTRVALTPYNVISLHAVASQSYQRITHVTCEYAGTSNVIAKTYSRGGMGDMTDDGALKLFLNAAGAKAYTLRAQGYEPVTFERALEPDEDVQLGVVYFVPRGQGGY